MSAGAPARRRPSRVAAGVGLLLVAVVAAVGVAAALGIGRPGPGAAGPIPRYVDETASSGLAITYDGPLELSVGGGVAVMDCDGDGMPDVYVAGGANPAGLFRNVSAVGGQLRFQRIGDPDGPAQRRQRRASRPRRLPVRADE
jgi:hypothetical protein